jgi:hypothetical protein
MSTTITLDPREVPDLIAELASVFLLAPCLDREEDDPAVQRESRRLRRAILRITDDLNDFLKDDVRHDIIEMLDYIDQNRGRYREAVLLWIDLLEDVAATVESHYGSNTGPLKNRQVRAAMYYLMKGFIGHQPLPGVPSFLRPIALEIAIRASIEFLVSLDNPSKKNEEMRPRLWDSVTRPPVQPVWNLTVHMSDVMNSFWERLTAVLVGIFLPPLRLKGTLRVKVDLILAQWQERNRATGKTPVQRTVQPVIDAALWVGNHAEQIRALVDLVSVAVTEAARLTHMSPEERIEVVKGAVVEIVEKDFGFSGPVWDVVVRMGVDFLAEAIERLFRKRGLLASG